MVISRRTLGERSALWGLTILLTACLPGLVAGQTVNGLPETVTGVQAPVPEAGPTGPTYSTFVVASPATGPVSVAGNPYNVWCSNPNGYILPTPQTYTAYNTYDPNFLALSGVTYGADPATAWQEVNWLINNKHGHSGTLNPSVMDTQFVIWDLLWPGYQPTMFLSPDAQQLLSDAQTYGPGFVPQPGQLLAVDLYIGGIQDSDGPNSPQDIFIEYPLPTVPHNPGLKITKSANVKTAKCTDQVTYTYVVTNTGDVTLTNVTIVDDNATPNYPGDDITIASGVTLNPGDSKTYTRTLYLPLVEYGVDAYNNPFNHTLITQVLPNGNIQVTLLEDLSLVDNSYGQGASPDWGSNGNSLLNHLGQDSAEFQFVDGAGNTVLDFVADYATLSGQYPSGIGTGGYSNGAGQFLYGNKYNVVSIDTTMTDNMNKNGNVGSWYHSSPPPNSSNWQFQCGYTVVIKGNCFGRYGYGGCNIKKIQHNKCKTGQQYQCNPTPKCQNVTNTVTATATANVNGTNQTLTATAQATVTLTPGGQQSCQPPTPPTCQCPCWNCQHGDHQHCSNYHCNDTQCQKQGCKQQQCQCTCWNCQHGNHSQCSNSHCTDQNCQHNQQQCQQQQYQCQPQNWWKQCNQNYQRCGRNSW